MAKIADLVIPRIASLYLHLVGKTSKVYWYRQEDREKLSAEDKNFIYAFWHGRQTFLVWAHKNFDAAVLVSQSKDGEYIARVLDHFGMKTVRGSSSRGGMRALIQLKQVVETGSSIAFTPDGPKGPQRAVSPGVIYLAQKTGKPILPTAFSAKRKLVFHGWDDYWIPLPFNTIVVGYGNPVRVSPQDDPESKSKILAEELNRLTDGMDSLMEKKTDFSQPPFSDYDPRSCKEKLLYLIYNFGLVIFSPLILSAIFVRYPKTFIRHFSEGLSSRLGLIPKNDADLEHAVWIHAASLGECRAAVPLARAIKQKYPGRKIVFSSTTVNGIAEAQRLGLADAVFFAPLDVPFVLRKFFKEIRPRLVLLLESEIWPNWIRITKEFHVPIGIVNGRISEKSAGRYSKIKWMTEVYLNKMDFVGARENADTERFKQIGIGPEKIQTTGNLKFDLLPWDLSGSIIDAIKEDDTFSSVETIWTAGSVRDGEETLILDAFADIRKKFPQIKLILAPRHLDRMDGITQKIESLNFSFVQRSVLLKNKSKNFHGDVLIWDTFGDLWKAYRQSSIVFVGGSLVPKGGQNPIEPARFSKPVLFGPHMENFAEPARILIESKGAIQIQNGSELAHKVAELISNSHRMTEMGTNAKNAMDRLDGQATRKTMQILENYF